jgi:hypothetical protein
MHGDPTIGIVFLSRMQKKGLCSSSHCMRLRTATAQEGFVCKHKKEPINGKDATNEQERTKPNCYL